jgi:AraC-like DNA-binding protein
MLKTLPIEVADTTETTIVIIPLNSFGITAGQLITKRRMNVASEILRDGSLPIAEVANASGHFDQSAFSRVSRRTVV